jgi:hypothetical protein
VGPRQVIYFSRKDNANRTTYIPPTDLLDGFYGTNGGTGRINGGTGGGGGGGNTGEPPPLAGGGGAAGAQDGAATGDGRTGGYQGDRCSQTALDRDGGGGGSGGGSEAAAAATPEDKDGFLPLLREPIDALSLVVGSKVQGVFNIDNAEYMYDGTITASSSRQRGRSRQ